MSRYIFRMVAVHRSRLLTNRKGNMLGVCSGEGAVSTMIMLSVLLLYLFFSL